MDIVILAGGKGQRIERLSTGRPKCLIEVAGVPFLSLLFDYLESFAVKNVILCVGVRAEQIESFVATQSRKFNIILRHDGPHLLGTGGAIINSLDLVTEKFFGHVWR